LFKNQQGTGTGFGKFKGSPFYGLKVNRMEFMGPPQENADGIGLDKYFSDFVSKHHHYYKQGNRTKTLEKPTGKDQTCGLGHGVTEPQEKKAEHDLKGSGAAEEQKEPMDEKAYYQNVCHILPLE
jgi:hypothetical protein